MAFLSGDQAALIREAFDNLHAANGNDHELLAFCFVANDRGEGQRDGAARSLVVSGLATFVCRDGESRDLAFYMPTAEGIDAAVLLGVISSADVAALDMARKRANLRAQGGA